MTHDPLQHLQIRLHGEVGLPTLVYLPGIHGDWTLIPSFRAALAGHVRFVEFSYPRTLTWSLDDYAAAISDALAAHGVGRGWLLGESFGSQVVWALLQRELEGKNASGFHAQGILLAGGFVRYPWHGMVRLARWITAHLPAWCLRGTFRLYARFAKYRHRNAPENLAEVREFIRRRLDPLDRQAIHHRLALIAENDPRPVARQTRIPVCSLVGLVDPVVPAWPVRRWLRRHCPGYRGGITLFPADHNVLGTAPRRAANWVRSVLANNPQPNPN